MNNTIYESREICIRRETDNNNRIMYSLWFVHYDGGKHYSPSTIDFHSIEEAKRYAKEKYDKE